MRKTHSKWRSGQLGIITLVLVMRVTLVYGQERSSLFAPPQAGVAMTVVPSGPAAQTVVALTDSKNSLFEVPQLGIAAAPANAGSLVRTLPTAVTAPPSAQVPAGQPWGEVPKLGYQSANSLWGQSGASASHSVAEPIDAYVVTPSGLQPVGCHTPVGLQGVDLSDLNVDGCSDGCGVASVAAPASCDTGGCCGGGCGSGSGSCCGTKSCGLKKCGLGGCGSCCGGGQMQCTSAACNNCQCSGLCGCDCCRPRFWAQAEVLLWFMDGYRTPALLTRSPSGTPQTSAGVLGNDSTRTLFGNQDLSDDLRVGGRLRMGYWFDPCRKFGIQGDFFSLGNGGDSIRFNGNGVDSFARPFFNTDPDVNAQDAQIFSRPGLAEGSVSFATSSNVISAAPTLRWNLCCCQGTDDCCNPKSRRVDFLLGYRFFRVEESFASQEVLRPTDGRFADGTRYELNDRIATENEFHGVEVGLNHMYQRGQWRWDISSLFAIGEVQRSVELDGSTRITVPRFQDNTLPGGFYVGPDDIGRYEDRDYAVIPQVRANLSYCLGCDWRLGVGYDFMYLSSMFRPDSYLNTTFHGDRLARQQPIGVVGDPPATPKRSMFLHGVNVNLSYNF